MSAADIELATSKVDIDVAINAGGSTGSLDDWNFSDPNTTAQDVLAEMQAENDKLSVLLDWSLLEPDDLTITITVRSGDAVSRAQW